MAGHSGQFTPGGYLLTLWYTLFCRPRTYDLPILNPTLYQ